MSEQENQECGIDKDKLSQARASALLAFASSVAAVRTTIRPVLTTLLVVLLAFVGYVAIFGMHTTVQDPTRIDAGLFRRWSFNRDNDRTIETKNRFGNVEAYKHTQAGSYRLEYDSEGAIWRPTGPRK